MKRDFLIGAAASVLVHSSVVWVSEHWHHAPNNPQPTDTVFLRTFPAPPLPDPDPAEVEPGEPGARSTDVARPPSLTEVPRMSTAAINFQPMQPAAPDDMKTDRSLTRIPAGFRTGGGAGMAIFNPASLDRQPVPTVRPKPSYPAALRHDGLEGQVTVEFVVDAAGNVQNAFAREGPREEFREAAVEGVLRWKFKPGRKGGKAVASRLQVPILFSLDSGQ